MKNFENLEKKLKLKFKNKNLLVQAFCHRSYLNEHPRFYLNHNERLEFLGDAVLELIVTEFLYKNYRESEGILTNWRAALVNAQILSEITRELEFEKYLLLSRGEARSAGKARDYILANTFEAFLGAFYLDQGYRQCQKFIKLYLLSRLPKILKEGTWRDSKSLFQEIAQEKEKFTPVYKVLKETGPDHLKYFTIGVFLDKRFIAQGEGFSKQEAELKAAEEALRIKGWKNNSNDKK